MPTIAKYIQKIKNPDWQEYATDLMLKSFIVLIPLIGGAQIALSYCALKLKHRPAVYRDVNGDGIEDKIINKTSTTRGLLGTTTITPKKEVLFGIEIDGKTLYLTKEEFEAYRK